MENISALDLNLHANSSEDRQFSTLKMNSFIIHFQTLRYSFDLVLHLLSAVSLAILLQLSRLSQCHCFLNKPCKTSQNLFEIMYLEYVLLFFFLINISVTGTPFFQQSFPPKRVSQYFRPAGLVISITGIPLWRIIELNLAILLFALDPEYAKIVKTETRAKIP